MVVEVGDGVCVLVGEGELVVVEVVCVVVIDVVAVGVGVLVVLGVGVSVGALPVVVVLHVEGFVVSEGVGEDVVSPPPIQPAEITLPSSISTTRIIRVRFMAIPPNPLKIKAGQTQPYA